MSTSLLIEFAAFTHLAEGQILCVTEDNNNNINNNNINKIMIIYIGTGLS
jgi:hypothetical protein